MLLPTLLRPRSVPVTDLRRYLAGNWRFERTVVHRDGGHLELLGHAVINETAGGEFVYRENATLRYDLDTYSFSRAYRYVPTSATSAEVMFEDGAHFYALDLGRGRCRVRHDCGDDVYVGLILASEAAWFTRWRCQGPAKDYVATTRLRRDQAAPAAPDGSKPAVDRRAPTNRQEQPATR